MCFSWGQRSGNCFPTCATSTVFVSYDAELGSIEKKNSTAQHIRAFLCVSLVTITGFTAGVSLHLAAVLHGTMVGHLN